jgi:NH3-dependent NAD+ synthetase
MPLLQKFVDAPPTAELEPITETYTQSDEVDMVRYQGSTFFLFRSILKEFLLRYPLSRHVSEATAPNPFQKK